MALTRTGSLYYETQALTRTAPTTDATDGVPTKDLTAVYLMVMANSTKTLTSGSLLAWFYDPDVAHWWRVPLLDKTIASSGLQYYGWPVDDAAAPRNGRMLWTTSSVVVSGGTDVRVHIMAQVKNGVY